MIEFAWPWCFAALPLPLLLRYGLPPLRATQGAALRIPFYAELLALHGGGRELGARVTRRRGYLLPAVLVWLLLVGAAARPQWLGDPVELPTSGRDLLLAVDLSGSMRIPDMELDGQQVDRLSLVKNVVGEFIQRRQGDRLGLVLFGEQAYVQTPLTFDRDTVQTMLNEAFIGMAGDSTAIGDAVGLAVKRLRQRPQENRVLVLLTDGANTAGEVDPLKAAQLAAESGVKIYTIGVGADEMRVRGVFGTRRVNPSRDLDETALRHIAEATGGLYFRARDREQLARIYRELDALEPVAADPQTFRPMTPLFHWPLGLGFALFALTSLVWLRGR